MSLLNDLSSREQNDGFVRLEVAPGANLTKVCEDAIDYSGQINSPVRFVFNGAQLDVDKDSSLDDLLERFKKIKEEQSKAYLASEAYKKENLARDIEDAAIKSKAAIMLANLDNVLNDQKKLVEWVGKFSLVTESITRIEYSPKDLAEKIMAAGYVRNAEVGSPPEEIERNKTRFGNYIVGQALNGLLSDRNIHPLAATFAARYMERPDVSAKNSL